MIVLLVVVTCILSATSVISTRHDVTDEQLLDLLKLYVEERNDEFNQQNEMDFEYNTRDKKDNNKIETNLVNDVKNLEKHTIRMPGSTPQHPDTYLCVSFKLPTDDRYIIKYEPNATMHTAHHMLLYGCDAPYRQTGYWQCLDMQPVCGSGPTTMMYAWAKNAPSLTMPDNVGFHVGGHSGYRYLVLQVHYLHVAQFLGKHGKKDYSGVTFTLDRQKKRYLAGITDIPDQQWQVIPPHRKKVHHNAGCKVTHGPVIHPFRFRTHAHKLATVVTGYRVRDGVWKLIGRGDPQKPQMFYKVQNSLDVKPGDKLIGRCTYHSESRDSVTKIGATHKDEMCNFYLMYYYDSNVYKVNDFQCPATWWGNMGGSWDVYKHYPRCNDVSVADMKEGKCTDSAE